MVTAVRCSAAPLVLVNCKVCDADDCPTTVPLENARVLVERLYLAVAVVLAVVLVVTPPVVVVVVVEPPAVLSVEVVAPTVEEL